MKLVVISGGRTAGGRTGQACEALARGAASAGAAVDTVLLPDLKLQRCRQCDESGWGLCRSEGRCVIEDDFAGLVDRIVAADAVAFATPVYFSDLAESLRAFLDRLRRTCFFEPGRERFAAKKAVGICVAGGGGGGSYACTVSLEKVLGTCRFDVVDLVPARRQNLEHKLDVLERTGHWLAGGVTQPFRR